MKNASTKLLPLFLLVASTAINAKVPADALIYYSCSSQHEAMQCSNCRLEVGIKVSHLVNVAAQKVIRNDHFDGTTEPQALEKCTVIDRTNWICGEGRVNHEPAEGRNGVLMWSTYDKTGGQSGRVYSIFESVLDLLKADGSVIKVSRNTAYWCAK
jgi:hypothetical protein